MSNLLQRNGILLMNMGRWPLTFTFCWNWIFTLRRTKTTWDSQVVLIYLTSANGFTSRLTLRGQDYPEFLRNSWWQNRNVITSNQSKSKLRKQRKLFKPTHPDLLTKLKGLTNFIYFLFLFSTWIIGLTSTTNNTKSTLKKKLNVFSLLNWI